MIGALRNDRAHQAPQPTNLRRGGERLHKHRDGSEPTAANAVRIADCRKVLRDQMVKLPVCGAILPANLLTPQYGYPVTGVANCWPVSKAVWGYSIRMTDRKSTRLNSSHL